jgi:DNA-damage-inducible protein D
MDEINQTEVVSIFEDFRHEDDDIYWLASDILKIIGYDDMDSLKKPIKETEKIFNALKIPLEENFIPITHHNGGEDYKLSRFACYIIVMSSDPRKEQVAIAQTYFVQQAKSFDVIVENRKDFKRLITLNKFTENYKRFSGIAEKAGLENYIKFQNVAYLALFNMYNFELAQKKYFDKNSLIMHVGDVELGANTYRMTITKIKDGNTKEQQNLEVAHKEVGQQVRNIVLQTNNKYPENLPIEKHVSKTDKKFKRHT